MESEPNFRLLAESGTDWIFWIDPDRRFRYVSPACRTISGYAPREFMDDPGLIAAIVHPDDRDAYAAHLTDLHAPDAAELEFRIRMRDGSERWIAHLCQPVHDDNGVFLGRRGTNRDVTARRRTESALRASESTLQLFIEHAPAALAMFDRDMRYLAVSRRWREDYRLGDRDLAGRSHYEIFPGIPERWKDAHRRGLAGEVVRQAEDVITREDGRVQWLNWEVRPWRAADGGVGGVLIFTEDVTERRAAEEQVRRLSLAVEQSAEMVFVTDLDARIEYVNDAFVAATGYAREEVIGGTPRVLKSGKTPRATYDAMWAALSAGRRWRGEFVNRRKDGSEFIEHAIISPLRAPDGRITHYVAVKEDITAAKRIAAELEHERLMLRTLLDTLPDLVWLKDAEGVYLGCNRRFEEFLGAPDRAIIGRTDYDFVDRDLADSFREHDRRAMAEGGPSMNVEVVTFADGHRETLETTKTPMRDAGGALIGVLGISHDITAHKEALQRLEDSEQRLVLATSAAKMGVWEYEFGADRLYWSPEIFAVLGLAPCEPTRALRESLEHEADRGISDAAMARAIATRTPYFAQYRAVVHGQTKWIEDRGTIHYTADGAPERVIGLARDITQEKDIELELQGHRQNLEALVAERTRDLHHVNRRLADTQFAMDRVGIGIHWVDPETGRFVYVNDSAAAMLGYSVEEMLALRVPDIDPEFADDFARRTAAIRDGGFARIETQARHRDGRMIPAEVTIYWLPNAEGGGSFISFMVDISARKRVEAELREAKVAAEAATVAKSAFLANMSHEIRTPMNGILGMAYLVRRGGVTPRQAEQLDRIANAGQHLLSIINDVLDLAKIESGTFDLADTVFARDDLVSGVTSLVADSARAKGIELGIDLADLPASLRGDRTRLGQALVNYLGNAVKFTERGSIRLHGTVLGETDDEVTLRFEVRDTGAGIPAAEIGRLFTAFQQVDQSSTRNTGGTGLGLAITKRIAEAMGGAVGVESVAGEGSTFWLTARLRKANDPAPGAATAHAGPDALLARLHAGAPILVVDDEDLNREVACELLRDVRLAPDTAVDGEEAVRKVQANAYRLIMMDMKMPGMDGLMATGAIRALPMGRTVPIVAVTANVYVEDRRACLDAGMNGFVAKPLEPDVLYATLLECLGAGA